MPHAKIAFRQAVYTLEQLHAELGGKILDNKREADRLRQAMVHVEAVIKMLDPAMSLRGISVRRRKPNQWFKRGTLWRSVLDVLREAKEPLTTRQVTNRVLAAKGVQGPTPKAVRDLEGAVRAALRSHEDTLTATTNEVPARWHRKNP
jgi:hypothetical protein